MAHVKHCASHQPEYSGDRRNAPDGDKRRPCDCDGFHTFGELYDHRVELFIALCRQLRTKIDADNINGVRMADISKEIWRSKLHADGSSFDGWFIMGINKETGTQITYHLPIDRWDETAFAETLDRAPHWDAHTPDDVIHRLKSL
jgi:hypothetical protein